MAINGSGTDSREPIARADEVGEFQRVEHVEHAAFDVVELIESSVPVPDHVGCSFGGRRPFPLDTARM